jgi:hypothetical protein
MVGIAAQPLTCAEWVIQQVHIRIRVHRTSNAAGHKGSGHGEIVSSMAAAPLHVYDTVLPGSLTVYTLLDNGTRHAGVLLPLT